MYAYVLPIEVILFQLVILAIAIAVEAEVFYDRFSLTRRQSIEYSTLLNVFSSIASWILFFILQGVLPEFLRLELISYVFLNHFYRAVNALSIPSFLMICGIVNFIFVCIVEFSGTLILQRLAPSAVPVTTPQIPSYQAAKASKKKRSGKKEINLMTALVMSDPHKTIAILIANTFSSGLIFLFFCLLGLLK
ncbi:filament integrity protein FraC [Oscillatoria sp. FACHB-1406]|uniref:filament integrity protein FraC n=1 Tax=Oscillatoria sp. FACHB-1406 TaxID=2692846 RepID=UPI0016824FBB|nr:filament integrity protein FraC [Oscillatoria sp. FACHB-1406]MBD2576641.1 hypothetical protein [Oscillatoria sp. FACHB-1406]